MTKLEKAYQTVISLNEGNVSGVRIPDARVNICVSVLFLCLMLSLPLSRLSAIILFALYPVIASAAMGLSYRKIFLSSCLVLPFIIMIGIFNPFFDRMPVIRIGKFWITSGWISFFSIIIRGLLCVQCVLILIRTSGFMGICRGLRKMGIPVFLTDQLMFVYRYISVLLLEAITMRRAIESRGFGRKNLPLKLWGQLTGQLFLRTIERAEKINNSMLSRGFNGTMPSFKENGDKIGRFDIIYLTGWGIALLILRFCNIPEQFR